MADKCDKCKVFTYYLHPCGDLYKEPDKFFPKYLCDRCWQKWRDIFIKLKMERKKYILSNEGWIEAFKEFMMGISLDRVC